MFPVAWGRFEASSPNVHFFIWQTPGGHRWSFILKVMVFSCCSQWECIDSPPAHNSNLIGRCCDDVIAAAPGDWSSGSLFIACGRAEGSVHVQTVSCLNLFYASITWRSAGDRAFLRSSTLFITSRRRTLVWTLTCSSAGFLCITMSFVINWFHALWRPATFDSKWFHTVSCSVSGRPCFRLSSTEMKRDQSEQRHRLWSSKLLRNVLLLVF